MTMTGVKLTLINNGSIQTIELNPSASDSSVVDTIMRVPLRVYQDKEYEIKIDFGEYSDVNSYYLRVNEDMLSISAIVDGCAQVIPENKHVFSQCYGYVRFQLICRRNNQKIVLESPLISVMVKKGNTNDSVRRMTEYIYRNNSVLLANRSATTKYEKNNSAGTNKTIETKIALLERIIGILEFNYSYFKINSRYKTVHIEKTDYFDKLQYVSSATIQYIAQHPDELRRTNTNTGIVIGGHRYQPERTLITQNAISYDTQENQSILGFIERLVFDAQELKKEIGILINANAYDSFEEDEYISSTYYVYISTIDMLRKMEKRVSGLIKRILAIQLAYSKIFNIKALRLVSMPTPTAIFMSVPQYKQLYDCMNEWLKCADVGLELQNQILGLKKMSEIYELYVLLKLIWCFSCSDYELISATMNNYSFSRKAMYKNTSHNNVFAFSRGEETVTLYYQPVLYGGRNDPDYDIGLYRNNSISLKADDELSFTGEYYAPDYVIKYCNPNFGGTRYFILDAKFSTKENVLHHQVSQLAFKYIFSLSPIDLNDRIIGLYIVNGQSEQIDDSITNIYDRSRSEGMIMPRAEIITITENSMDNNETHKQLFANSIGRFL